MGQESGRWDMHECERGQRAIEGLEKRVLGGEPGDGGCGYPVGESVREWDPVRDLVFGAALGVEEPED